MGEHSARTEPPVRIFLVSICFAIAFVFAAVFYGASTNLAMLTYASLALVAGVVCLGPRRLGTWFVSNLLLTSILFALAALLILSFQAAASKDTSYPATWVILMAPLALLVGCVVGEARQYLAIVVYGLTLVFALLSTYWFVVAGERAVLPLLDPNNYAALLYAVILPMSYLQARETKANAWLLAALVVLCFALGATQSRYGSAVLCGVSLLWVGLALLGRLNMRQTLVVCGLMLFAWCVPLLLTAFWNTGTAVGLEAVGGTLPVRATLWSSAYAIGIDYPWLGAGLGGFGLFYRQLRSDADAETAGLMAHNDLLQLFAEGGVGLATLFLVVCGFVGVKLWRILIQRQRESQLGIALAVAALLGHALINFVFYTPVLGLVVGLWISQLIGSTTQSTKPQNAGLLGGAVVAALFVSWGYLLIDTITATSLTNQPGMAWVTPERTAPQALQHARQLQRLNPERGLPYFASASIQQFSRQSGQRDFSDAAIVGDLEKSLQLDPFNTNAWWQLRDLMANASQDTRELEARVLHLDPLFVPAIQATLYALDSEPLAQRAFLKSQVGNRLLWLARENREAALAYASLLVQLALGAGDTEDAEHYAAIRQQIEAVRVNIAEGWFL